MDITVTPTSTGFRWYVRDGDKVVAQGQAATREAAESMAADAEQGRSPTGRPYVPPDVAHMSPTGAKMDLDERERQIVRAMAGRITAQERADLDGQLQEVRAQRRAEAIPERAATHLPPIPPVHTGSMHSTETDWLDDIVVEGQHFDIQREARNEAVGWFRGLDPAVIADHGEFGIQAQGVANRYASQFGQDANEARSAFYREVLAKRKDFLTKQAKPTKYRVIQDRLNGDKWQVQGWFVGDSEGNGTWNDIGDPSASKEEAEAKMAREKSASRTAASYDVPGPHSQKCPNCGAIMPDTGWTPLGRGSDTESRCGNCGHVLVHKGEWDAERERIRKKREDLGGSGSGSLRGASRRTAGSAPAGLHAVCPHCGRPVERSGGAGYWSHEGLQEDCDLRMMDTPKFLDGDGNEWVQDEEDPEGGWIDVVGARTGGTHASGTCSTCNGTIYLTGDDKAGYHWVHHGSGHGDHEAKPRTGARTAGGAGSGGGSGSTSTNPSDQFDAEDEQDEWLNNIDDKKGSLHTAIGEGSRTPWGTADDHHHLGDGVDLVGTPSHGGIHCDRAQNAQVKAWLTQNGFDPAEVQQGYTGGWWEEDLGMEAVVATFPEMFTGPDSPFPAMRGQPASEARASATESLTRWFDRHGNRSEMHQQDDAMAAQQVDDLPPFSASRKQGASMRLPDRKYNDAGEHIGPGPWLDVVHEINRIEPGTFGAPSHDEPNVETYPHHRIVHRGDGTVSIFSTTDHGADLLGQAANNLGSHLDFESGPTDLEDRAGRPKTGEYHYIRERGGKYEIWQKGTGKTLSTHDTKEEAEASFRAMMQSKHGVSKTAEALSCDMKRDCHQPVTHIDNKGFVYCTPHGESRRAGGVPTRKMTKAEVSTLEGGGTISYGRHGSRTAAQDIYDFPEGTTAVCVQCGEPILLDQREGGGPGKDWGARPEDWVGNGGVGMDFGCEESPLNSEEGTGGHSPKAGTIKPPAHQASRTAADDGPTHFQHMRAGNDPNGNPQRLFMRYKSDGSVHDAIDEGYGGRSGRKELEGLTELPEVDISKRDYHRLLKEHPSSTPYQASRKTAEWGDTHYVVWKGDQGVVAFTSAGDDDTWTRGKLTSIGRDGVGAWDDGEALEDMDSVCIGTPGMGGECLDVTYTNASSKSGKVKYEIRDGDPEDDPECTRAEFYGSKRGAMNHLQASAHDPNEGVDTEQSGEAGSSLPYAIEPGDPNDVPAWPFDMDEFTSEAPGSGQPGKDAAGVAGVPTPGQNVADYPDPGGSPGLSNVRDPILPNSGAATPTVQPILPDGGGFKPTIRGQGMTIDEARDAKAEVQQRLSEPPVSAMASMRSLISRSADLFVESPWLTSAHPERPIFEDTVVPHEHLGTREPIEE